MYAQAAPVNESQMLCPIHPQSERWLYHAGCTHDGESICLQQQQQQQIIELNKKRCEILFQHV